jgi:hypothetical protein
MLQSGLAFAIRDGGQATLNKVFSCSVHGMAEGGVARDHLSRAQIKLSLKFGPGARTGDA